MISIERFMLTDNPNLIFIYDPRKIPTLATFINMVDYAYSTALLKELKPDDDKIRKMNFKNKKPSNQRQHHPEIYPLM